jgi:hypothetical protein
VTRCIVQTFQEAEIEKDSKACAIFAVSLHFQSVVRNKPLNFKVKIAQSKRKVKAKKPFRIRIPHH